MERPAVSIGLSAREFNHFGPLLGFLDDEPAEVGSRAWKHRAAQLGKSHLHSGVGQTGVDRFVEQLDDWRRRILRSSYATPEARFEARQKICDDGHVRQNRRTRR